MTQSVNWSELMASSGGAFEPLPKGPYDIVVHTAEATRSSTDKLMFKVVLKVEGGPHNGRNVYHNIVVTTDNVNAMRMFFLNMKAFGLGQEYFKTNPIPEQIAAALVGQRATIVVDHRMYQGQQRENVKSLIARAGGIMGMVGPGQGPVVTSGPQVPTPGANPIGIPTMPGAPPVVSQPHLTVVQPTPVESTVNIPMPQNPVPAEAPAAPVQMPTPMQMPTPPSSLMSEPGSGVASNEQPPSTHVPATGAPILPAGMTPEMFAQFQAFQAAQAAAAPVVVAPTAPAPVAPAMPTGAPAFPLPDGEAF